VIRRVPAIAHPVGSIPDQELRLLFPRWLEESRGVRAALAAGAVVFVGLAASLGPLEGALAVAVIALAIFVAHRPLAGVLLMAAVVPITSGLARGIPVPGFRISELLTVLIAGTILATVPRQQTRPWAMFDRAALAYAAATLLFGTVDLVANGAGASFDDVGTLLGPVQFLLIYRATLVVIRRDQDRLRCLYFLVGASALVAVIGILQQLNVGPFRSLAQNLTGLDVSGFSYQVLPRATGPFDHWQALGGYLFMVILIGVALLAERPALRVRALLLGVLALDVTALLLSGTIAPMVFTLIGAAAIAVWGNRDRGWRRLRPVFMVGLAALVAIVVCLPVISQRASLQYGNGPSSPGGSVVPASISYRYDIWSEQYIPAVREHWLTGYGPEIPPEIHWQYTESLYLTLLLRGGIVLLLAFIALMITAALRAKTAANARDPGGRAAGRALLVAVLALVALHGEIPYFVNAGLPHVFWILVAVVGSRTFELSRSQRSV
jgi:hypothetical protein